MTTVKTLHGKSCAGNSCVRHDDMAGAPRCLGRFAEVTFPGDVCCSRTQNCVYCKNRCYIKEHA